MQAWTLGRLVHKYCRLGILIEFLACCIADMVAHADMKRGGRITPRNDSNQVRGTHDSYLYVCHLGGHSHDFGHFECAVYFKMRTVFE